MRKKISILVLCMLLVTPLCLAQTTAPLHHQTTDADVPVWSVGDYWTYRIDNLTVNVNQSDFLLHVYISVADFKMTVTEVTNDSYQLTVPSTSINAHFALYINNGDGPINITGELKRTTIQGTIFVAKADIGIKEMNLVLKGKLNTHINQQPYIQNYSGTIPFTVRLNGNIAFDTPYTLLAFPLNESSVWGLPASKVTLTGTIKSPWFNVINFLNHFARRWGLIPVIANALGIPVDQAQSLSDMANDILPIVDIAHVMNTYLGGNSINITEIPDLFYVVDTENVTVPAGTFMAYNISLFGGLGYMYYAPDAGHIIKSMGQFGDISSNMISNLDMELKATNFQP